MGTRNSKSKNSDSEQVSQTKKPTLEEVFPIATNIQHSGYQLMLRKIFNYFKLENWLNWFYNPNTVAENPCQTLLLQTPAKRPRSQNRPLLTADFDHL